MADDKVREPTFRYEDIPELMEVFADSIGQLYFDGNTLRLELLVSRLDEARERGTAPTGRRRPVSRLVLSAPAAVDMINRCRQLSAALEQAGVLKKTAGAQAPN